MLFDETKGITGSELRYLLSPIEPEVFVSEYWAKKPLFIKGHPDKFKGLFDRAAFDKAVNSPPLPGCPPPTVRAISHVVSSRGNGQITSYIQPKEIPNALHNKKIVSVSNIDNCNLTLSYLLAAIKTQLSYPGPAAFNCFLSTSVNPGAPAHWDATLICTMQIEGSKIWKFSNEPVVPWPHRGTTYYQDDSSIDCSHEVVEEHESKQSLNLLDEGFSEVNLEAGDILILPAGTWHQTRTVDRSLALALTFSPKSFGEILLHVFDNCFGDSATWRSIPLLSTIRNGASAMLSQEITQYLIKRLAEASELLGNLRPDSIELVQALARGVADSQMRLVSIREPMENYDGSAYAKKVRPLQLQDRMQIPYNSVVYSIASEGGARLSLYVNGKEIIADGCMIHFLRTLLEEKEFDAKDCLQWTEDNEPLLWEDVEPALQELLDSRVIEYINPSPES